LLGNAAVSPAPTALVESVQTNEAYKMYLFVHENPVKAKASGAEGAFSASDLRQFF